MFSQLVRTLKTYLAPGQNVAVRLEDAPLDYRDWSMDRKIDLWRRNPLRGNVRIRVPGLPEVLMYSENDDSVIKELWWTGFRGWELSTLLVWFSLAQKARGIVLDIGSYTGIFSIFACLASSEAQVFAFEAQARGAERVRKNLRLNKARSAEVFHAAVADKSGVITLHYYEKPDIISSIASINANEYADRTIDIPSIGLDEADFLTGPVNLIKIDIEGAELRALGGMRQLIATSNPDLILEANEPHLVERYREFLPRHYTVYAIDDENKKIFKVVGPSPSREVGRNYLLTPRSHDDLAAMFRPYGLDLGQGDSIYEL